MNREEFKLILSNHVPNNSNIQVALPLKKKTGKEGQKFTQAEMLFAKLVENFEKNILLNLL